MQIVDLFHNCFHTIFVIATIYLPLLFQHSIFFVIATFYLSLVIATFYLSFVLATFDISFHYFNILSFFRYCNILSCFRMDYKRSMNLTLFTLYYISCYSEKFVCKWKLKCFTFQVVGLIKDLSIYFKKNTSFLSLQMRNKSEMSFCIICILAYMYYN